VDPCPIETPAFSPHQPRFFTPFSQTHIEAINTNTFLTTLQSTLIMGRC
jgi:hypothetical protein